MSQSRPTNKTTTPAKTSSKRLCGCPAAATATRLPARANAAIPSRNPREHPGLIAPDQVALIHRAENGFIEHDPWELTLAL